MTSTYGTGRYIKGPTLGEGTFGVVYQAEDKLTGNIVAIKKIRLGNYKEGVNVTALREIKLLKELNHPNIIKLVDVFPHKKNLYLVFEYMETDLEAVIKDRNIILSIGDIKAYLQMTLKGLAYCHNKYVLHRDMKPNNLLIANNGELKIADFGLARIFGSPDRRFTHQVFARWYRPPELLYGSKQYSSSIDIWALGCVFAELLLRRPFLQGSSDIDQLGKIFAALGTPKESNWPGMTSLPDYVEFFYCPGQPLKTLFPMASDDAINLLQRMLTFDPNQRITAQQALDHRFFVIGPPPTKPEDLPRPPPKTHKDKIPEAPSPSAVFVLSPDNKSRRVTIPPQEGGSHLDIDGELGISRRGGGGEEEAKVRRESVGEGDGRGEKEMEKKKIMRISLGRQTISEVTIKSDIQSSTIVDSSSSLENATPHEKGSGTSLPMSVDEKSTTESSCILRGPSNRPTLNSIDKKYLRKRKLDMDVEFHNASQDSDGL